MSIPHSLREQGWCSGESTHLPPMQLMFDSRTHDIMWVEFVLVHVLALRGFSPGILDFPSPQKAPFPNSSSVWIIVKHLIMSLGFGDCASTPNVIDIKLLCFYRLEDLNHQLNLIIIWVT